MCCFSIDSSQGWPHVLAMRMPTKQVFDLFTPRTCILFDAFSPIFHTVKTETFENCFKIGVFWSRIILKTSAPFRVYDGEQVKTDTFDSDDKTWVILRVARFAVSACVADVSFPFPSAKQAIKQASEEVSELTSGKNAWVGEAGLYMWVCRLCSFLRKEALLRNLWQTANAIRYKNLQLFWPFHDVKTSR